MKRKLSIVGIVALLVIAALVGIRIYGAFQSEQESAVARANDADQQSQELNAENDEDQRKIECSTRWLEYQNDLLSKQIAELKGAVGHTPLEPSCDGYAMSLDETLNISNEGMRAILNASNAKQYAIYEREYSINRPLQAKFLARRLWVFLKGTKLEPQAQAMMQKDQDDKNNQVK
jgi:hypothetical protein